MKKVKFNGWNYHLHFGKYPNARVGFELLDDEDNGCVAMATMNLPDIDIADDEVIIKDYSENDGMLDALIEADIISGPVNYVSSGFISAPVCKLLVDPNETC
jgi:hypothetical protein